MAQDEYKEVWLPANLWVPDKSVPPAYGTRVGSAGALNHGGNYSYWAFDDTRDEVIYTQWIVPEDYDSSAGELEVRFHWEADAISGNVGFRAYPIVRADGETLDTTFFYNQGNTDIVPSTTRYLNASISYNYAVGIGTVNAGELMVWRLNRVPSIDTLVGDARFIGMAIQYHALEANNQQWS